MTRFEEILLQIGRACEASVDADEMQGAFAAGRVSDMELLLALSKARVECGKAAYLLDARVSELEAAALSVKAKEAA